MSSKWKLPSEADSLIDYATTSFAITNHAQVSEPIGFVGILYFAIADQQIL